jgi:hypothetical protein
MCELRKHKLCERKGQSLRHRLEPTRVQKEHAVFAGSPSSSGPIEFMPFSPHSRLPAALRLARRAESVICHTLSSQLGSGAIGNQLCYRARA